MDLIQTTQSYITTSHTANAQQMLLTVATVYFFLYKAKYFLPITGISNFDLNANFYHTEYILKAISWWYEEFVKARIEG